MLIIGRFVELDSSTLSQTQTSDKAIMMMVMKLKLDPKIHTVNLSKPLLNLRIINPNWCESLIETNQLSSDFPLGMFVYIHEKKVLQEFPSLA